MIIKEQEKPIGTVTFNINELKRTLHVYVFGWGVDISVVDITKDGFTIHDCRAFYKTKNYPSITSNIRRGMRYFKANDKHIEDVLKLYEDSRN